MATITATPAADQLISHNGKEYTTVKEGLAYILIPRSESTDPHTTPRGDNEPQAVFYNPIQQFNRDLTTLVIKAYGQEVVERKRKFSEKRHQGLTLKKGKKRKFGDHDAGNEGQEKVARVNGDTANEENLHKEEEVVPAEDGKEETATESTSVDEKSGMNTEYAAQPSGEVEPNEDSAPPGDKPTEDQPNTNGDTKPKTPSFTILDALSASGLRAIRFAKELPFVTSATANDLVPEATKLINLNVQHNGISEKVKTNTGNAIAHMYSVAFDDPDKKPHLKSKKYDVIDLDPYGTAAPFLDAAVQAVQDGGLLCVTCTDAGVWASNGYPEKCYSLYGGVSIKGMHSHEGGLRLILQAIAASAARCGLAMEPLLSLSIDFYARVFVKIKRSPAEVKYLAGKTMIVYNCDNGCGAWTTQLIARNKLSENKKGTGTYYKHSYAQGPTTSEYCQHCGTKTHVAGPMYAGPLHVPAFIRKILDDLPNVDKDTYKTTARIKGMLNTALEETIKPLKSEAPESSENSPSKDLDTYDPAAVDEYPFFFIPSVLSKVIHCVTPHEDAIRGAIRHLGYRVTRSHTKGGTIKTDAPWTIIWEIMREWVRQKAPIKEGAVRPGTAGYKILRLDKKDAPKGDDSKEEPLLPEIVFDEELGKETDKRKLVRYQANPRDNWGPMTRARGRVKP